MRNQFLKFAFIGTIAGFLSACNSSDTKKMDSQPKEVLDLSAMDTTINPADNFFDYANGTWMKNTEIPASKSGWGSFYIVDDQAVENMHTILDSCANLKDTKKGTPTQQIADLYKSYMDTVAIEEAGIKPIQPILDRINSIATSKGVIDEVVTEFTNGDGTMFSAYISPDDKNSNLERAHFDQGGLGLPIRDYYFKTDPKSEQIRKAYENYIAKLFTLSGIDSTAALKKSKNVIALETKMAKASKSPVDLRDPQANYHLISIKEFNDMAPALEMSENLKKLKIDVDTVLVGQPEFYKNLSDLIKKEPVETWKDYLTFHNINTYSSYLSTPFADAKFDFYGRTLSGQKEPEVRWKKGSSLVNRTLSDALGQLYVEKYFPPSAKKYMLGLVDNLQETYADRIKNIDWMSDSTKTKALEKLNSFTKKIGYPDKWKDYSSIDIEPDSLIKNMQNISLWNYNEEVAKLGKPVDKTEWEMTPATVNAYYNPSFNEIVFPAGILQPPFYYQNGDDAVNYGAIGAVIGHEMTHGFDDQGSQYDLNGNLENWWTDSDRVNFKNLTSRIVKQYGDYEVLDSLPVNGELTQGENIADNGGLAIAYAAFQKTDEAKSGKKINGLTPDERFFLAFAQVWRIKDTDEQMRMRINVDPHSPETFRVNGTVSNMPEFYKAFNVTPKSKLYRPDSIRTTVW